MEENSGWHPKVIEGGLSPEQSDLNKALRKIDKTMKPFSEIFTFDDYTEEHLSNFTQQPTSSLLESANILSINFNRSFDEKRGVDFVSAFQTICALREAIKMRLSEFEKTE